MTVGIFIYARSDSSRLPNKHFLKIKDHFILDIILERLQRIKGDFRVYLLTTNRDVDDSLSEYALRRNLCDVYRGEYENVAKRTIDALCRFNLNAFIRVNGDCPLVDFDLIQQGVDLANSGCILATNIWPVRSFPYGISLEMVNSDFYKSMYEYCSPADLEHVTSHIYRLLAHDLLNIRSQVKSIVSNINFSEFRLTVDTLSDFQKIVSILEYHDPLTVKFKELCNDSLNKVKN